MIIRYTLFLLISLFVLPVAADSHHPQQFLQAVSGSKDEGEQIYNHFCVNCHSRKPLISLGAPEIGNENAWKSRLQYGLEALFKHTDEGMNAMPPRGGCFECTDKQLLLAIMAMLPKQAKKDIRNELKALKKHSK